MTWNSSLRPSGSPAARLGHADPAITRQAYGHVVRTAETAAADVFANAMNAC